MLKNLLVVSTKLTTAMLLSMGGFFAYSQAPPNVVLIITDDQGYGDLGIHGNPHVKTPVLDQFAKESIQFNNFYVSPVCAPTRSSLMTGRYSLRTGVRDTYNGGAIMHTDEITIAEMLKSSGYGTGMFGKWHLGDNYPSRPMDQGFDETVMHLAGGMGQVGDFTTWFQGDRSYFDPVLWHNGKPQAYEGYCSDIFTDEALKFIEENQTQPFFCYLSFNAPHTPLQVPDRYYQRYKGIDPTAGFDEDNRPFPEMSEKDKEDARRVYAMVSNIDDNIGRILHKLESLGIEDNTVVIFMTDNGPQQKRYVAGLRGRKSDVYRGGVRVPLFVRNPLIKQTEMVETNTAHIDMLPTLASICGAKLPEGRQLDGKDLLPLMLGEKVDWENRPLFFNWTRKYPEKYRNVALQKGHFKLVGHTNYDSDIESFELFDLKADPFELNNIVKANQELAKSLKQEMDQMLHSLIQSKHLLQPPLIKVGHSEENPIVLNRNDAKGQRGIWAQQELYGYWDVSLQEGYYDLKFKFIAPLESEGRMVLETGTLVQQMEVNQAGLEIVEMKNVYFPSLSGSLRPFYTSKTGDIFPFWVEMYRHQTD
jgi:arylsulfatase